ncbi:hypothetical protein, partial [Salmonella enterica]
LVTRLDNKSNLPAPKLPDAKDNDDSAALNPFARNINGS